MQKRVLTIQDFSCMGRCSLTVALPTLSCSGVECVCLPTAILSNHTMFRSWTYTDLTDDLEKMVGKWMPYNHSFDCIYTGYLSNRQVKTIIDLVSLLKEKKTMVFVDPAMADNGQLYHGFDFEHVESMKKLISMADYIKPNLTEACLLAGVDYPMTETEVGDGFYTMLFERLSGLGMKHIIITGQEIKKGYVADLFYDCLTKKESRYVTEMYPGKFHGTGDLFSSSLVGCLMNGIPLAESVRIAHDFLHKTIRNTIDENLDGTVYGAVFEPALFDLMEEIRKEKRPVKE